MALLIGVPRETASGEKRVATVPDVVEKLIKLGFSVAVESGAGDAANFADDTYIAAGAQVLPTAADVWAQSDIVFKVRPPSTEEVGMLREGYSSTGMENPWGKEAILHDGIKVGRLTSGGYSVAFGKQIGMGYVPVALAEPGQKLKVKIQLKEWDAVVTEDSPFDRTNARIRIDG